MTPGSRDEAIHEALHSTLIAQDLWNEHVLSSRGVDLFSDIREAALEAADAMGRVYQLLGEKWSAGGR